MIKVFSVDDHALVRRGIRQILAETDDIRVTEEAENSQELLERLKEKPCDVILLDISMPGRGGIDMLKQIKTVRPEIPVLILSMHPEDQYAVRALKAGAAGYVTKAMTPVELVEAIRRVFAGRKYVSETLAEKLALVIDQNMDQPPHKRLSDREFEVLRTLSSGKTVSEIADEMALSVKTISTYRSRILQKMNMKNNAELTRYSIENRIVD